MASPATTSPSSSVDHDGMSSVTLSSRSGVGMSPVMSPSLMPAATEDLDLVVSCEDGGGDESPESRGLRSISGNSACVSPEAMTTVQLAVSSPEERVV